MRASAVAAWFLGTNAAALAVYGLLYLVIPDAVTRAVFGVGYPSVPFAVDLRAMYAGTSLGLAAYFAAALRTGESATRGALLCCALLYACTAASRLTALLALHSGNALMWIGCAGECVAAASAFAAWGALRRKPHAHPAQS